MPMYCDTCDDEALMCMCDYWSWMWIVILLLIGVWSWWASVILGCKCNER